MHLTRLHDMQLKCCNAEISIRGRLLLVKSCAANVLTGTVLEVQVL